MATSDSSKERLPQVLSSDEECPSSAIHCCLSEQRSSAIFCQPSLFLPHQAEGQLQEPASRGHAVCYHRSGDAHHHAMSGLLYRYVSGALGVKTELVIGHRSFFNHFMLGINRILYPIKV